MLFLNILHVNHRNLRSNINSNIPLKGILLLILNCTAMAMVIANSLVQLQFASDEIVPQLTLKPSHCRPVQFPSEF